MHTRTHVTYTNVLERMRVHLGSIYPAYGARCQVSRTTTPKTSAVHSEQKLAAGIQTDWCAGGLQGVAGEVQGVAGGVHGVAGGVQDVAGGVQGVAGGLLKCKGGLFLSTPRERTLEKAHQLRRDLRKRVRLVIFILALLLLGLDNVFVLLVELWPLGRLDLRVFLYLFICCCTSSSRLRCRVVLFFASSNRFYEA